MSDVSKMIAQFNPDDPRCADELLPLVYEELRKLAAARLAQERPGQTLEATALVHEAYVRLVSPAELDKWDGRRHFFAAAAEAMRRILVEQARRKSRLKHGGAMNRIELAEPADFPDPAEPRLVEDRILQIDAALDRLAEEDPLAAQVVKLHYFAGTSLTDIARILGSSRATVYRHWTYAKSWLKVEMQTQDD